MGVFLYVQNHEISVAVSGSPRRSPVLIGDLNTAFSGKPLQTVQTIRDEWTAQTTWLTPGEARLLAALMTGRGHTWDFNDTTDYLYSSKGLGASTGTVANGSRYTTTSKFGSAGLQITASNYVQFNVGYTDTWTAFVWQGSNLSTAHHYIVDSSGNKWVDGVSNNAASTPFINMVAGNFRLGDPAGTLANNRFDDLVLIDTLINDEWAADFGTSTAAFGLLPKVRVRGSFMGSNTYHVIGSSVSYDFTPGTVDGVFYEDLTKLSFTMLEYEKL